ncbi:hypothetical protein N7470_007449 [Penicillium chermesinum]|nr:hypothetical protein N7470_007449 [Penicillium chermesinum]
MSRPSRTQQLQNPRLVPKLSEETPNPLLESAPVLDLVLAVRKLTKETSAGIADSILAKRDEERGRKTDLDGSFKRGRSISSHSDNSVSTISTNRSPSASPDRRGRRHGSRSVSPRASKSRKRRYSDSADSYSGSSYASEDRQRSRSRTDERNIRRRRRENSPDERGRHMTSERHGTRSRRSHSIDQSRIAKGRRSLTPDAKYHDSERRAYRARDSPSRTQQARSKPAPRGRPEPRERSMSPYSKRLALTQSVGR